MRLPGEFSLAAPDESGENRAVPKVETKYCVRVLSNHNASEAGPAWRCWFGETDARDGSRKPLNLIQLKPAHSEGFNL